MKVPTIKYDLEQKLSWFLSDIAYPYVHFAHEKLLSKWDHNLMTEDLSGG